MCGSLSYELEQSATGDQLSSGASFHEERGFRVEETLLYGRRTNVELAVTKDSTDLLVCVLDSFSFSNSNLHREVFPRCCLSALFFCLKTGGPQAAAPPRPPAFYSLAFVSMPVRDL